MFDQDKFKKVYARVRDIFRPDTDDPRFQYVRANWIFPNHIDLVIEFGRQLANKYSANEEVVVLGALLHDVGLVYKRESADTVGHEDRSAEYTEMILSEYGYPTDVIEGVKLCIYATEPSTQLTTLEQKVLRTADGLAHILSVHYYAKAKFSPDWDSALKFITSKIEKDWGKLSFEDERNKVEPIYLYIKMVIEQHWKGEPVDLASLPWVKK